MTETVSARRAASLPKENSTPETKTKTVDRRQTAPEEFEGNPMPKNAPRPSPQLKLSDGDVEAFRHLAHNLVTRTLAHECEYRQLGNPEPSSSEWKLLKRQEHLNIYKRRGKTDEEDPSHSSKSPSVLAVGSLEGSLEDILYGTHSKNRDEMHATAAYLHNSHMDCAVFNVIDSGTDEDPFRQLALKWFISETLGDARLVNHRDFFNIESTGMDTDSWGRRYGYFLARHIEHPGCPAMPEDSDVIRAKMDMCCIYRQEPGSRVVDVYAKGSVDLGGGLQSFMVGSASVAMMLSMEVAMQSAEGRRLTLLALEHSKKRKDEELKPSQHVTTESLVDILAASTISSSVSSSDDGKTKKAKASSVPCSVCGKKAAWSKLVRSSHRKCGVCKERVCGKCYVKRKLYGRHGPVSVACCKVCILASKRLEIDPRDQTPILP